MKRNICGQGPGLCPGRIGKIGSDRPVNARINGHGIQFNTSFLRLKFFQFRIKGDTIEFRAVVLPELLKIGRHLDCSPDFFPVIHRTDLRHMGLFGLKDLRSL